MSEAELEPESVAALHQDPDYMMGPLDVSGELASVHRVEMEDPDPVRTSLRALGVAVAAATTRMRDEMLTGKSAFGSDRMRSSADRLISHVGRLIELLEKNPPPLKPNPRGVFVCVVCRSRWQGMSAEKLLTEGHTLGEVDREEIFKFFKKRSLR